MIRSATLSRLLAATATLSAQAATITQTETFDVLSLDGNPDPQTQGKIGTRLTFDRFDTSLGTLDAVRTAFTFDLFADLSFQCLNSGSGDCENTRISSQISLTPVPTVAGGSTSAADPLSIRITDDFPLFGSGVNASQQVLLGSRAGGMAAVLRSFDLPVDDRFVVESPEQLIFDLEVLTDVRAEFFFDNSGPFFTLLPFDLDRHQVRGNVSLTYDFTPTPVIAPVPLPAGMWMLLGGLGLLVVRRRAFATSTAPRKRGPTV